MESLDSIRPWVGAAALGFSIAYFVSDAIEVAQGGFSTGQLVLTLVAEVAIPFFVIGLYVVQLPRIVLVAATQGAPEGVQIVAAGARDLGFAGMGAALLAPFVARPRVA